MFRISWAGVLYVLGKGNIMSTVDETKLTELQAAMGVATSAFNELERRIYARKGELEDGVRKALNDEFGAEKKALQDAKWSAEVLCREEANRVRRAKSMVSLPWPVGTKLVEFEPPRGGSLDKKMVPTGEKAVLEVYEDGDPVPMNARWHRPSPGQVVLRLLKKDGTPGTKVECWNSYAMVNRWYAEGVDPNEWKKA